MKANASTQRDLLFSCGANKFGAPLRQRAPVTPLALTAYVRERCPPSARRRVRSDSDPAVTRTDAISRPKS